MKLLVATEFPPDAPGGGPAVVRQMLQGFPGEVHWWSVRGSVLGSSCLVPGSSSAADIEGLRSKVERRGARVEGFQVSSFHSCPPGKLMPAKKLPKLRAFLMEHLWAPLAARSLRQAIEIVKPDCVWIIPHDFSIFPSAKVLANDESQMTDKKTPHIHVSMHDFVDAHNFGDRVGTGLVHRLRRMQDWIYQNAATRDVICEPMGKHLQERTGKSPTFICRKGIDPDHFTYLEFLVRRSSFLVEGDSRPNSLNEEPRTKNQEPIKIAYAGTILCEPEFALLVALLEQIRNQEQRTKNKEPRTRIIELHLYGAHSYADRPWFRPWILEHGNLAESDLIIELRKCHWGLSLMALDGRDQTYNRYSFPAKFCTYFSAGLPVITLGHPDSSVMKMASAYNVGITIQSRNPSLEDLAKALFSAESKQAHLPEILRCSREQFDAEAMRAKLWGAFGLVRGS